MTTVKTTEELKQDFLISCEIKGKYGEIMLNDLIQAHCDELVRLLEIEIDAYPESYLDNEMPRHYLNQAIAIVKEVYKSK